MSNSLARRIIRDSLRIRDRDRLWIHTWDHAYDSAEEIAKEAQSHGASTVISIQSESLMSHVLKKSPQEAVSTSPEHWFHGVSKSTAFVVLNGPEDPTILKTVDSGKASNFLSQLIRLQGTAISNRVLVLDVLSTGFTEKAAKAYSIDYEKWLNATKRCLEANQADMLNLGKQINELIKRQKSIHVSSSEGTDLTFRIRGSEPVIDDGIIDQDDIQRKTYYAQLPAGTISVPVEESSAEGTVVFNWPRAFLGGTVENLRLNFKKGEIVDYRVLKGEESFARVLRAASGSKDRLTYLRFGINPNATEHFGHSIDALIPGTISLGLGDNTRIGGRSHSNFSYEHTLNNAIVSIGPTAVIMDGKLTF